MPAAPHAEPAEGPGGGHPGHADAIDDGRGGTLAKPLQESLKDVALALGDAADRAVCRVRDPAVETERHRLAEHEVAEAHALDAADDGRIEPDDVRGRRRHRSGSDRPSRPGQDERVEDELRRDVRREPLGGPGCASEEGLGVGEVDRGCDRAELIEQDRVVDGSRSAHADEHEIARDVRPQPEQDLDAAAAFGGRRSGGRGCRVISVGCGLVVSDRLQPGLVARESDGRGGRGSGAAPSGGLGSPADPAASAVASAIARGIAARAEASRAAGPASVMSSRRRVSSARIRTASGAPA